MKLPKTLKIGNRTVSVKTGTLEGGIMGQYSPHDLEIRLSKDLSPVQAIETFWHEVIHAINDYNRVMVEIAAELERENADIGEAAFALEERITENFARVMLQVIQDNPDIVGVKQ